MLVGTDEVPADGGAGMVETYSLIALLAAWDDVKKLVFARVNQDISAGSLAQQIEQSWLGR